MRTNCNLVTMVGLTNDERCLIHKQCGKSLPFWKNCENVFKYMSTFKQWIIHCKCYIVQTVGSIDIGCFADYMDGIMNTFIRPSMDNQQTDRQTGRYIQIKTAQTYR